MRAGNHVGSPIGFRTIVCPIDLILKTQHALAIDLELQWTEVGGADEVQSRNSPGISRTGPSVGRTGRALRPLIARIALVSFVPLRPLRASITWISLVTLGAGCAYRTFGTCSGRGRNVSVINKLVENIHSIADRAMNVLMDEIVRKKEATTIEIIHEEILHQSQRHFEILKKRKDEVSTRDNFNCLLFGDEDPS